MLCVNRPYHVIEVPVLISLHGFKYIENIATPYGIVILYTGIDVYGLISTKYNNYSYIKEYGIQAILIPNPIDLNIGINRCSGV